MYTDIICAMLIVLKRVDIANCPHHAGYSLLAERLALPHIQYTP